MLLVEKMDEGPLISVGEQEISASMTAVELTVKLIDLSSGLLRNELPRILSGKAKGVPQEQMSSLIPDYPNEASYSRKLTKDDGIIDWNKPAAQIEREIRAYIDWPKSRTTIAGKDVIVIKAHSVPSNHLENKPGDIEVIKDDGINILMAECGEGYLCIDRLKPAGKAEMTIQAFLAGYGDKITSLSSLLGMAVW